MKFVIAEYLCDLSTDYLDISTNNKFISNNDIFH
jgi:hypothetical protein